MPDLDNNFKLTHAGNSTKEHEAKAEESTVINPHLSPPFSFSVSLFLSHSTLLMYDRVMCCGTVTFHHFDVGVGPQKYSPYVTVPVVRQRGPCEGKSDGCVCPWRRCVCMCILSTYNMYALNLNVLISGMFEREEERERDELSSLNYAQH